MNNESDYNDALSEFHKVVFLDLEGVVVTHKSILYNHTPDNPYRGARVPNWNQYIDRCCLGLVYRLAMEFAAQIVLTSTMRNDKYVHTGLLALPPVWMSMDNTLDYMSSAVTEHRGSREEEIQKFVEDFEVKKFVVFDDRELKIKNFVLVNPHDGISMRNFNKAKEFLIDEGQEIKYEGIFL